MTIETTMWTMVVKQWLKPSTISYLSIKRGQHNLASIASSLSNYSSVFGRISRNKSTESRTVKQNGESGIAPAIVYNCSNVSTRSTGAVGSTPKFQCVGLQAPHF